MNSFPSLDPAFSPRALKPGLNKEKSGRRRERRRERGNEREREMERENEGGVVSGLNLPVKAKQILSANF